MNRFSELFAPVAGHCKLCPKCRPVAEEIFRVQAEVAQRRDPHATIDDTKRVAELTGELCAQGARMWEEARQGLARALLS